MGRVKLAYLFTPIPQDSVTTELWPLHVTFSHELGQGSMSSLGLSYHFQVGKDMSTRWLWDSRTSSMSHGVYECVSACVWFQAFLWSHLTVFLPWRPRTLTPSDIIKVTIKEREKGERRGYPMVVGNERRGREGGGNVIWTKFHYFSCWWSLCLDSNPLLITRLGPTSLYCTVLYIQLANGCGANGQIVQCRDHGFNSLHSFFNLSLLFLRFGSKQTQRPPKRGSEFRNFLPSVPATNPIKWTGWLSRLSSEGTRKRHFWGEEEGSVRIGLDVVVEVILHYNGGKRTRRGNLAKEDQVGEKRLIKFTITGPTHGVSFIIAMKWGSERAWLNVRSTYFTMYDRLLHWSRKVIKSCSWPTFLLMGLQGYLALCFSVKVGFKYYAKYHRSGESLFQNFSVEDQTLFQYH